jgi:hypothetical protein
MKRNLMNQVERVRKYASNLTTGIAVADAPIRTAASGRSWWTIPLKTRCLGGESSEDQRLTGTAACSDWCAICFRPERSEGNNFEVSGGMKKYSDSEFRFLIDNTSEGGADYWLRILLDLSHAMIPVVSTVSPRRFPTTALRLRRVFL